jgi:putative DNA primase/helicase
MTAESQFRNIPQELRQLPQWVCWRSVQRDGKPTKMPVQPSGAAASSTNPKTWSTFEDVANTNGLIDGVGFVFTKQAGYTGVDLDKCRDPKTGESEAWALEIIRELDSYTEVSQSGTGWHVIIKGTLRAGGNKCSRLEMYDCKRYFCMTGTVLSGVGRRTIEARDIAGLQKRMLARTFGSSSSKAKSKDDSASAEDFRLIGEVQKQARTSDPAALENAFRNWYPVRYRDRNRKKGDRAGKNYSRYSIEKFLAQHPVESILARIGSTREDSGNADRFAQQNSGVVRFWHKPDLWLVWAGMHWQEDENAQVVELAKRTARSIYQEAANLPEDEAARMGRWAERSLNRDKIMAMLRLATSDPRLAITTDKLDSNPWLLNFENGTVDLRTGELREHRRDDYITKIVRCNYTPDLNGPRWLLFVDQMFGDLAGWVQKAVGYSLTGITNEKVVFLLLGPTDTGKTTFLSTIRTIFHDYSSLLQIDTLMSNRTQDSNTLADLADLRGARFVVASETEEGHRLREATLKRITQGMGCIKAVRKYENPIIFPESHKIWIDANFAPTIRGVDDAIWKRLLPIACMHKPKKKDPELAETLRHESEAIASWVVAGAVHWHKERLGRPQSIEAARESWKSDLDFIADFIAECCVKNEEESILAFELYRAFLDWATKQAHEQISQTAFGRRLSDRGFKKKREGVTGRQMYCGLQLKRCVNSCE